MDYSAIIFGPQLIGVLFIIIGLVQRYLPPKKINRWYGYRTLTARANQQTWDEGNRYSALYMIRAGTVVLVAGFIINALTVIFITDAGIERIITYIILFGGAMGIGILSTMATEKHLKNTFKIKKVSNKKRK
jgi:uncharacterized membrane protein